MTISRRSFCSIAGAGLAAAGIGRVAGGANSPLRVIAYNIYACTGWPQERELARLAVAKGQMARRLAGELELYNPDVVNFSESPSEKLALEIAERLGMHHVRFPSGGSWPGTLLSKLEFVESQNVPLDGERPKDLFTRHWGKGKIILPDGEPVIIHSAHLYPGADPATRIREVTTMLKSMKVDLQAGHSMLLIGDLNHRPETEEYRRWTDAGWVDTFARAGKGDGLTIRSDSPEWRIDYVLAAGPIANRIVESRPLFQGSFRLNTADAESFALSDHLPQMAVFKGG